jgi:hypothetical protein
MIRLVKRENLISAPGVMVGICDGCGHLFPLNQLAWEATSQFVGSLCCSCGQQGWVMCWCCGRLTRYADGVCDECWDRGVR